MSRVISVVCKCGLKPKTNCTYWRALLTLVVSAEKLINRGPDTTDRKNAYVWESCRALSAIPAYLPMYIQEKINARVDANFESLDPLTRVANILQITLLTVSEGYELDDVPEILSIPQAIEVH